MNVLVECLALSAAATLGGASIVAVFLPPHPNERPGYARIQLLAFLRTSVGGMLIVCALFAMSLLSS